MALKAALALAFLSAPALAAAPPHELELDGALGSDDTCGPTEGADCALNALQRKMAQNSVEGDTTSACWGDVAKFAKMLKAEGCLYNCPDLCGPLDKIARTMKSAGKGAAKQAGQKMICSQPNAFKCAFQHGSCKQFLPKAKSLGLNIPGSQGAYDKTCGR